MVSAARHQLLSLKDPEVFIGSVGVESVLLDTALRDVSTVSSEGEGCGLESRAPPLHG